MGRVSSLSDFKPGRGYAGVHLAGLEAQGKSDDIFQVYVLPRMGYLSVCTTLRRCRATYKKLQVFSKEQINSTQETTFL